MTTTYTPEVKQKLDHDAASSVANAARAASEASAAASATVDAARALVLLLMFLLVLLVIFAQKWTVSGCVSGKQSQTAGRAVDENQACIRSGPHHPARCPSDYGEGV